MAGGVPEGYRTLSPYLIAPDAEELVRFVSRVFETSERRRMTGGRARTTTSSSSATPC
jgi:uncharacterized glyoxalase superfamily protein PhnB